jgi:hypothetical protein
LTDPDHLKSAAEYLLQVASPLPECNSGLAQHSELQYSIIPRGGFENEAPYEVPRSSEGRYRKQPNIDALRQYKEEILEAPLAQSGRDW